MLAKFSAAAAAVIAAAVVSPARSILDRLGITPTDEALALLDSFGVKDVAPPAPPAFPAYDLTITVQTAAEHHQLFALLNSTAVCRACPAIDAAAIRSAMKSAAGRPKATKALADGFVWEHDTGIGSTSTCYDADSPKARDLQTANS